MNTDNGSNDHDNGGTNRHPWVSVFNLCNAAVGAGVIAFPFAFSQTGAVGGVLFTCLVWLMEVVALCILIRASERVSAASYQELVLKALGPTMSTVVAITMLVYLIGSLIAYLIIVGDVFQPALSTWFSDVIVFRSRGFVIFLFAVIVVLPLSLKRTIESLKWTSLISVLMLTYISVLLVSLGTARLITQGGPPKEIKLFKFSLKSFSALDIFVFAFQCHIQVVPIFAELANRPSDMWPLRMNDSHSSVRRPLLSGGARADADMADGHWGGGRWSPRVRAMDAVIFVSLGACLVAYNLVGEFGYLTFPEVGGDVLVSFDGSNPFVAFARVGMAMVAIACYPLCSHPARSIANDWMVSLLRLDSQFSAARHVGLTLFFWALAVITAVSVSDLGTVFSFVGSTGGVLVIFVIPAFLLFRGFPLFSVNANPLPLQNAHLNGHWDAPVPGKLRIAELCLGALMLIFGTIIFAATTYSILPKRCASGL